MGRDAELAVLDSLVSQVTSGVGARYRLFERVQRALEEQAGGKPQLLVIDDPHRADEASLRLLAYLSETLWPTPMGMIVTWRDTEVPPASLTAGVIAALARGPNSHRCDLGGLSPDSVAQWLSAAGLPWRNGCTVSGGRAG